jgi:histone deacetylase 1/2
MPGTDPASPAPPEDTAGPLLLDSPCPSTGLPLGPLLGLLCRPTSATPAAGTSPRQLSSAAGSPASDQPTSDGSSAHAPPDQHPLVTWRRNDIHRQKEYTDGTVRYNPYRHSASLAVPASHRTALAESAWRTAMEEEFDALHRNRTWTLVPRPHGINIIGSKWIFQN